MMLDRTQYAGTVVVHPNGKIGLLPARGDGSSDVAVLARRDRRTDCPPDEVHSHGTRSDSRIMRVGGSSSSELMMAARSRLRECRPYGFLPPGQQVATVFAGENGDASIQKARSSPMTVGSSSVGQDGMGRTCTPTARRSQADSPGSAVAPWRNRPCMTHGVLDMPSRKPTQLEVVAPACQGHRASVAIV